MKKYICTGRWKVWGSCGFNHWTELNWTNDYEEAVNTQKRLEEEAKATKRIANFWIEEDIKILEPLK